MALPASFTRSSSDVPAAEPDQGGRTFVLDTSVLLSDPKAIHRFAEHEVVLPVVVITELEGKRNHPELGYFAREALRLLDDLRTGNGRLDAPLPIGEHGGTLRVELNHADLAVLPDGFRGADNDSRILAVARSLASEGQSVTLVSKDLPMRIKASAIGLAAEEYQAGLAVDSGWTGLDELELDAAEVGAVRGGDAGAGRGPRPALPHRPGDRLAERFGPGPGHPGEEGQAGPRRP